MPDYKTPGVYIEEQDATGPIAGVGTSTAAFIGPAPQGRAGELTKVTNLTRFKEAFGDSPATDLTNAVRGFFENGGTAAWIVRVDTANDYDGALTTLRAVDDVSLVCVPGVTDVEVQQKVVDHCQELRDRFAILDAKKGAKLSGEGSVLEQRQGLSSERGYGALYHPWLRVANPAAGGRGDQDMLLVPPSGHVAGIFARSDSERGVHKAPANELIIGASGLEQVLDDRDQEDLNDAGINVLRVFAGRARPVVWGARTLAPREETAWRYVNVRRLFLFIEESIEEGIRWAVFEPNDVSLWKRLERTIMEFLTRVWSAGALFGATASEAFYVKIDDENNPPAIRELGRIEIEIGIAPVRPAEFVVVNIGMWPGGAQIEEG